MARNYCCFAPPMMRRIMCLFLLFLLNQSLFLATSFVPKTVLPRCHVSRLYNSAETAFLADPSIVTFCNATCILDDKPLLSRRKRLCFRKAPQGIWKEATYEFHYKYKQVKLGDDNNNNNNKTRAILLIHPIGVGIDSWFYNRLLQELYNERQTFNQSTIVLAPDLLACGSASNPIVHNVQDNKLPLLNVSDWSLQVQQLMSDYEQQQYTNVEWCIVSNGGCVPIALQVAQDYCNSRQEFHGTLSNVVLSAPPGLAGLLQYPPSANKVKKNFRILSGITGKLFWWWSLRKNGKFIQKFSEGNLAASPENLGSEWTPTCFDIATIYPNSRYSTFMFLAGALQQSCKPALDALQQNGSVSVDVILGGDKRKNPAKSWFWERKRQGKSAKKKQPTQQSLAEYLQSMDIPGGRETIVGGRRCPAHEDAKGFAQALISYISTS